MFRRTAVALAVLALPALAWAEDKKDDKAPKLEGTYTIVSGEKGGKPIPDAEIKGSVVVFKGDRIIGTDKDKKEFFAASYTLDSSAKPMKIMMTSTAPKEAKTAGVIQIDGDTVKICYALPGADAPTEFKTKENQQCFVLKRAADPAPKGTGR